MGECFVLVTDDVFGIFDLAAQSYPVEFFDNIECVKKVKSSDIGRYLLDKVGRNMLIAKNFNVYSCLGEVYYRTVD